MTTRKSKPAPIPPIFGVGAIEHFLLWEKLVLGRCAVFVCKTTNGQPVCNMQRNRRVEKNAEMITALAVAVDQQRVNPYSIARLCNVRMVSPVRLRVVCFMVSVPGSAPIHFAVDRGNVPEWVPITFERFFARKWRRTISRRVNVICHDLSLPGRVGVGRLNRRSQASVRLTRRANVHLASSPARECQAVASDVPCPLNLVTIQWLHYLGFQFVRGR